MFFSLDAVIILFLFWILGTFFGSFSTVLIERWYSHKWGILFWRSECPSCHRELGVLSLIPIFSYILQRGRCSHCQKHISLFYPIAEGLMGAIFTWVWYFILSRGIDVFSFQSLILLFLWFVTGVYMLYDARYMEVPDEIVIPAIYGYSILLLCVSIYPSFAPDLMYDLSTYTSGVDGLFYDHILAAILFYSFLYIQILIPGSIFLLKKWRYKDFFSLLGSYFFFPFMLITFLWRKEDTSGWTEEIPTWVGWGDLRIGLLIGLTLGTLHGFMAFALAYITGSIVGILIMASRKKGANSQIPFGPFLGFWWIASIIFYDTILSWFL